VGPEKPEWQERQEGKALIRVLPSCPSSPVILFLFLSHLAVGIVLTLVFVSREAGVKFFRFNAGLAAILLAVAFALRPPETSSTDVGRLAVLALVVAEAAILVYWATVGRVLAAVRPLIAGTAVIGLGLVRGWIKIRSGSRDRPVTQTARRQFAIAIDTGPAVGGGGLSGTVRLDHHFGGG